MDYPSETHLNTLRPRQNDRHFPDDIFKWIFLNENVWISINISLKFVPRDPFNNIPTLVQVMAWRRPGVKQLSEPMMVRLPTHICVTWPQWIKPKSREILFVHNLIFSCQIVLKFGTAVSLPCSEKIFKTISQLKWMLWTNEISRDLNLWWVLDGYMLHQPQVTRCTHVWCTRAGS